MSANSYNRRTNSDTASLYAYRGWNKSDPVPEHIYDIRQSLLDNQIITHSEIIKCSTEFIRKLEPNLPLPRRPRTIKRCHYVNHCPICNYLREEQVENVMNPYRKFLLDNAGKNILMTFKLRHKNDPLLQLQNVLKESIKKLKDDNVWKRRLFPSKYRFYVKTEFEISWSEDKGFHPHCHLQIGTTNPMPAEEIKSFLAPAWKRIVSNVTTNKYYIPNLTNGVDVRECVSGKHSEDKKHFEDTMKKLNKKSDKDMKDKFRKINMDDTPIIISYYSLLEMNSNLNNTFIPLVKEIYKKTIRNFRRIFFKVNPRHPLFSKFTPSVK